MSKTVGILLTAIIAIALVAVCNAYNISPDGNYTPAQSKLFWRSLDIERLLVLISFAYVLKYVPNGKLPQFVLILYIGASLNSLNTSLFGDVRHFGIEQKVFGWIAASVLIFSYVGYNIARYSIFKKLSKANEECKKVAKDKYKILLNKMEEMENKLNKKTNDISDAINGIS